MAVVVAFSPAGAELPAGDLGVEGPGLTAVIRGVRIRGTLTDIDPLNKVPFKRATSRVQKGPL